MSQRRTKTQMVNDLNSDFTDVRTIGSNIWRYQRSDGTVVVRYYETDIVSTTLDGTTTLNSGGFRTITTKKRINQHLFGSWNLYTNEGVWYLSDGKKERFIFRDGITINPDGTITGAGQNEGSIGDLQRKIKQYCNAMKDLDQLPLPGTGDCFICRMPEPDCIESHLDEIYIHGTLILNAMRSNSCTDFIIAMAFSTGPLAQRGKEFAVRAVRKYLKKQIGVSS